MKRVIIILLYTLALVSILQAQVIDPSTKIIAGYWHNWASPVVVKLSAIPYYYNVINISFLQNKTGSTWEVEFTPDNSIYPNETDFINDIARLKSENRRVQLSLGGQNGHIVLNNKEHKDVFVKQTIAIIEKYGFNGFDVDLEGASIGAVKSSDFANPGNAQISYFIEAVDEILVHFGKDFWLTAAPETYYVEDAVWGPYGNSLLGAYLPFIYHFRNRIEILYPQIYNHSDVNLGNVTLTKSSPDGTVWHCDQLLNGFTTNRGMGVAFPALPESKVGFGKPACTGAAGSGVSTIEDNVKALKYIKDGVDFGSKYKIKKTSGYPDFRGVMTWSINWDATKQYAFAKAVYEILKPGATNTSSNSLKNSDQPKLIHLSKDNLLVFTKGIKSIHIYDLHGKQVTAIKHINPNSTCILPVSVLKTGIYTVVADAGTTRHTKTISYIRD
jgi:chitinase